MTNANVGSADRIRIDDAQNLALWAKKLDATSSQIRDAVQAVGDQPADVELYLKGSRSATNSELVEQEIHSTTKH